MKIQLKILASLFSWERILQVSVLLKKLFIGVLITLTANLTQLSVKTMTQNQTPELHLTPTKQAPTSPPKKTEIASLAAGCFWGVEQEFRKLPGVLATAVGYTGGRTRHPTYREVCYEDTGHAETVMIEFDPALIRFEHLLEVFWDLHDPTTLNRQGPDVGDQYRSAIFYHSEEQKQKALVSKKHLEDSGELDQPIVTEITPAQTFWPAEEYHQQYVEKGGSAQCHFRVKRNRHR